MRNELTDLKQFIRRLTRFTIPMANFVIFLPTNQLCILNKENRLWKWIHSNLVLQNFRTHSALPE